MGSHHRHFARDSRIAVRHIRARILLPVADLRDAEIVRRQGQCRGIALSEQVLNPVTAQRGSETLRRAHQDAFLAHGVINTLQ